MYISDIICVSKKTRKEFVKMNFWVELKKITQKNIDEVLALKVSAEQNNFVEIDKLQFVVKNYGF